MDDLQKLQYECENCHRDILLALADLAEDETNHILANGYRYLANYNKWPLEGRHKNNVKSFIWEAARNSSYEGIVHPHSLPTAEWTTPLIYESGISPRVFLSAFDAIKALAVAMGVEIEMKRFHLDVEGGNEWS